MSSCLLAYLLRGVGKLPKFGFCPLSYPYTKRGTDNISVLPTRSLSYVGQAAEWLVCPILSPYRFVRLLVRIAP